MLYVYQIPEKMSDGYCFGDGVPIEFTNVDWFEVSDDTSTHEIVKYVLTKKYVKPDKKYIIIIPERDQSLILSGSDRGDNDNG